MGVWTIPFYGLIFGSGLLAFIVIRKVNRGNEQIFQHSLVSQPLPSEKICSLPSPVVRSYLIRRVGIIAGLVLRAGSELSLGSPGTEALAEAGVRGAINRMLRKSELWGQLEPEEADLFLAADGIWTSEQKGHTNSWCEQLRLLRWTLGLDAEIEPLAHVPKLDLSLTEGVLDPQQVLARSKDTRELWEVRRERDRASEYTLRVISELLKRGLLDLDSLENSPEAVLRLWHDPSTDVIAGVKTVGELDDHTPCSLGSSAVARLRYADYLLEQLQAQTPTSYFLWLTSKHIT